MFNTPPSEKEFPPILEPSLRFRWLVDIDGEKKLQQKFCNVTTKKYHWITVETFYQHDIIRELEEQKGKK